ncbi:putative NAC domain-containing protein 94 [Acorus calamus]|uniref:NAC domain-containing protein 94 n=1 Tax=Acorus calamus TaxID=4465 RepID=A0AAV9DGV7_ACOCL|nr:putative NAC domain-containing protein 94 [Acorus calamus]
MVGFHPESTAVTDHHRQRFMAVSATMNCNNNNDEKDDHEHDVVMPGFRFHPTEEELINFYLRRKVQGKRFNVELITSLDLYRYDPWELPALAAIGEKEWFFYVPRDRKYRNGDRPNRVTTSGYWKATGADRMIRAENLRQIGLKKTLVFYSGKAPKGAEISLCRVYKRPGVDDHSRLPGTLSYKPSSSRSAAPTKKNNDNNNEDNRILTGSNPPSLPDFDKLHEQVLPIVVAPMSSTTSTEEEKMKHFTSPSSSTSSMPTSALDDLQRLVGYQNTYNNTQQLQAFPMQQQQQQQQQQQLPLNALLSPLTPVAATAFSDKLWDWNPAALETANREYNSFK